MFTFCLYRSFVFFQFFEESYFPTYVYKKGTLKMVKAQFIGPIFRVLKSMFCIDDNLNEIQQIVVEKKHTLSIWD